MKSRAEIPSVIEIAPEEVRDLAKRLREHPEEAVTESFDFSKLPNLYHYKVMDVLTIFYRKYQHCKDEDSKESLLRMMASKINKRYVSQTGSSLTHLQEITAHFLTDLLMMDQLTETNVNFEEYQFLLDTLGNQINTFGDKNDHNTPLMWGIANTSYSSVLLFISSIEKKGYLNQNSIDTHCTSYGRGSALFLACCKGENHRADQLLLAFAGAGMKMEPIIKKLLQSGASPTDKSDSTEKYSPIDIMVMRRSPEMLQLMIRHLKKPLTSEEIDTLRSRLKLSYAEIDKTMNKYGVVYTLPSRITWHQNLKNINQILDDIDPRIALTSKFKDIQLQYIARFRSMAHNLF